MDEDHEIRLKTILKNTLSFNDRELAANMEKYQEEIISMPIISIAMDTKKQNNNCIFLSHTRNPYWCILNDFSFQLWFKERQTKDIQEYLFGLNNIIPKKECLNIREDNFKIGVISDTYRERINERIYLLSARKCCQKHRHTLEARSGTFLENLVHLVWLTILYTKQVYQIFKVKFFFS